ncbi:MAG: exo-alpha-sialidase [Clostridia bacterium]|nr:exo-alpha-sialidase [Clostridia bacterium]
MVKSIKMTQVTSRALSCEPLIKRTENGELLCLCQCGGTHEPAPENRVYVFHSKDEGKTWSSPKSIYPEDGQAVYCTELSGIGNELTAYLTVHNGTFLDWKCFMMKSYDNGYTWKNCGTPPFFPEYTFMRAMLTLKNGNILLPYQTYPVTHEEHERIRLEETKKFIGTNTKTPYCESGVLISSDGGKTYSKHSAAKIPHTNGWIWSEPTIAELSDGTVVMLMRNYNGYLFRCDSTDGGRTWGEYYPTDIPNPRNKPRLIMMDKGRIALLNTPNNTDISGEANGNKRFPYELWITDDDMRTWSKTQLTDFPGSYSYSDGFFEDGHLRFVVEHNRHTVIYFDVEI